MNGFRKKFVFPDLSVANWFPGHMAKAMRMISRQLQYCDCILEVHDARIPFSGRNPRLNVLLRGRPKILLLNKVDLANKTVSNDVLRHLRKEGERTVLFTNFLKQYDTSVKELMSEIRVVTGLDRSKASGEGSDENIRLLVLGMPNVGKSSLINALRRTYLRKGKGTKVGKLPGVTRAVSSRILVSEHPRMYLVDTPGVMMPNIESDEVAMKLAILGMLQDHLIGEKMIADYLLFILNQQGLFKYTEFYNLQEPCDDIDVVLTGVAKRLKALTTGGFPDYTRAAQHFLRRFRSGHLGRVTLDTVPGNRNHFNGITSANDTHNTSSGLSKPKTLLCNTSNDNHIIAVIELQKF